MIRQKCFSDNEFPKMISIFIFQASFWRRQRILSVPQGVLPQPENKKADEGWVGNNPETDGETSTVCCSVELLCAPTLHHIQLSCFSSFFIILIVFPLYIYTSYIFTQLPHLLVVPSRCSSAFFNEERTALRQKRQKMRLLQQGKMSDVSNCKDLPDEIPLRLNIGTKVTGKISESKVLTVSTSNHQIMLVKHGSLHCCENPNTATNK